MAQLPRAKALIGDHAQSDHRQVNEVAEHHFRYRAHANRVRAEAAHHAQFSHRLEDRAAHRDVDALVMENARNVLASIQTNEFDAVTDFAQPIPVLTIAGILGVPVADHHHLMQLGVAMTKTLDLYVSLKDLVMMNQAAKEFIAYFREQIKIKKEKPDDGLLGRIVRKNKEEKAGLTEEELISIGIFLFTAGEETSAGLISNTLLHLGRHPDQRDLLRKDPGLMAQVIDEVLRYDSVVQLLGRLTREDVMLGGKVIPKDSAVTLVVGSGNRDAQAFEEPDRFIISRRPNRHLSFGSGAHYCLGDWLGRRQSQLAVSTFLQRFPGYRLVDGGHSWYKNIAIRRLDKLIVQAGS